MSRKVIKLQKRGAHKMAVMAKDRPNLFVIDGAKAKDFVDEYNKNVITPAFLEDCKKASSLFRKKRFK